MHEGLSGSERVHNGQHRGSGGMSQKCIKGVAYVREGMLRKMTHQEGCKGCCMDQGRQVRKGTCEGGDKGQKDVCVFFSSLFLPPPLCNRKT